MREPVQDASRFAPLAGPVVLALPPLARPASAEDSLLPLVDPRLGPVIRRTVERAAVRLADPACAAVLHDFDDDRTGRPLAETLAASGQTPSGFLASLRFVDADHIV